MVNGFLSILILGVDILGNEGKSPNGTLPGDSDNECLITRMKGLRTHDGTIPETPENK